MIPDVRRFPLGAVPTVTTGGILLAPMAELYDLLGFMTGVVPMTHQLARVIAECAPALLDQHPTLRDVVPPAKFDGPAHAELWLAIEAERHGARLLVAPFDPDDHTPIHPLTELLTLRPAAQVIAVDLGDEED